MLYPPARYDAMTSTMFDTTHKPRTTTSESDGDDDDDDVDVIQPYPNA